MTTVKDCLSSKSSHKLYSVASSDYVLKVLELMRDHHIRLVLVMDAGKLEGIISQGDCIAKVLLPGLSAKEVLAKEIMTSNLIYAAETDDLDSCMQTMISKRIHYLPVKNEDEFIGVLSIGDAIRHTFNEKTSQIGSLERQIKEWDNSQH